VAHDGDWPARIARVVASEVRRYRNARGLTAEQLAARCSQLGLSLNRSVIANLESGRRPLTSVAELLVLARALEVPPVRLVVPLGHAETIEVSPGKNAAVWDAFRWFVGEARLQESAAGLEAVPADYEAQDAIRLFREHDYLLERWRDAATQLGAWRARWREVLRDPAERRVIEADYGADPFSADSGHDRTPLTDEELSRYREEQLREREDLARSGLRSVREVMRQAGLAPPPLPRELANLPGERNEGTRERAHDLRRVPRSGGRARRQAEPDLEPEAGG
jgi:transcriptional regulator with XRE-family HTH domain